MSYTAMHFARYDILKFKDCKDLKTEVTSKVTQGRWYWRRAVGHI